MPGRQVQVSETQDHALRPMGGDELLTRLDTLETENANLREALESRVVIEQAKGVLAERLEVSIEEAFGILRLSARGEQIRLDELANQIRPAAPTPFPIIRGLAREQRWGAVAQREKAQASQEGVARLRDAVEEQWQRLRNHHPASGRPARTRHRFRLINSTDGRELGWFTSRRDDWKPGDLVGAYNAQMTVTAIVEPHDDTDFSAYLVVVPAATLDNSSQA